MMTTGKVGDLRVVPATIERWDDLEALFGPRGAYSGCWCMFWRLRRADFGRMTGEGNRSALRDLAMNHRPPGVLGYVDGTAVGWCSIGPREDFAALERSRTLKRVDDAPVWSIVCFFVAKPYRRKGMMAQLLRGAVNYAASQGATTVEAYPIDLHSHRLEGEKLHGYAGFMGIVSVFEAAGFVKVADASETQWIMRYPKS